jgi:CrcB protein
MGAAPGLQSVLGVMAGGALGALARYLVAVAVQGQLSGTPYGGLPLATLLVNVTGSFLLAFLVTLAAQDQLGGFWLLTLGTGFVGAFTTFSTFELEAHSLLRNGSVAYALVYVGGNLFLGYGALLLGQVTATRFQ